jgi:hypothetical protein
MFKLDPKTTAMGFLVLALVVTTLFIVDHDHRDKVMQLALAIAGVGLLQARDSKGGQ